MVPALAPGFRDEFFDWQMKTLMVEFLPRAHLILEKNMLVPFEVVRQAVGQRHGCFGKVMKVSENGQMYARKSGKMQDLEPELEILRKLPDSPHCVHLRASYQMGRKMHIIMSPWADFDLKMFLERNDALPEWFSATEQQRGAMLMRWMNCLTAGLADFHQLCVKHKDIKPSNVLLVPVSDKDPMLHPVFCDFGSSRHFSQHSLTLGQAGCTPFYQAPERQAGQPAGRKADVFSLGCVLLELAFLAARKKRAKLMKPLGKRGFASTPFITGGGFAIHLPTEGDWWIGVKDLLLRMLKEDPKQRPDAEEAAGIMYALCSAASSGCHCRHIPKVQGPAVRKPESPQGSESVAESDDDAGDDIDLPPLIS